jgi:dipeptidyl aminopeptidase/acylaminoacyl peptidase
MSEQHDQPQSISKFLQQRLTLTIFGAVTILLIIGAVIGLLLPGDQAEAPDDEGPTTRGQIAYLAPASSFAANLYVKNIATNRSRQLTDFSYGIEEQFRISEDGESIAFAARAAEENERALDVFMVDIDSGELTQLTNCAEANASCYAPSWHPNGDSVGYTREELDPELDPANRKRAWLVDIDTLESQLLFDDEQIVGHSPVWGGDGERVALVSTEPVGILIYEYATENVAFFPTVQDVIGVFSPTGEVFLYPELVRGAAGATYFNQLELVNFETDIQFPLSGGQQAPVEDMQAAFAPSGDAIATVRRYLDDRYTNGGQVYYIDLETGDVDPMVVDGAYSHGSVSWDSTGNLVAMQRFSYDTTGVDVVVYDQRDGKLYLAAEDAFLPKFIQD